MKLKYRKCKSLKEFTKILRKYKKNYWHFKYKRWRHEFFIWLSIDIINNDLHSKEFINYCKKYPTLERIRLEVIENIDKKENLIGISITEEDYYYIYQDKNGLHYSSCVGGF